MEIRSHMFIKLALVNMYTMTCTYF